MMEGLRSIIMELLLKFIFSFLNFFRYIYDIQRWIIVIFWIFINRIQRLQLELFESARMSKCFFRSMKKMIHRSVIKIMINGFFISFLVKEIIIYFNQYIVLLKRRKKNRFVCKGTSQVLLLDVWNA